MYVFGALHYVDSQPGCIAIVSGPSASHSTYPRRARSSVFFHSNTPFYFTPIDRRNNGFLNMLRTMKGKALVLGGESALRAAVEQVQGASPAEVEEEQKEGGAMAAQIHEK